MAIQKIPRKHAYINEIVEMMDARLKEANGDPKLAYSRLSPDELSLIELEISRSLQNTPESVRYFLENWMIINTKGEDWQQQRLQSIYPFTDTQEILWSVFAEEWNAGRPLWLLLLKARQIRWSTLVQGAMFQRTISNKLTNSLVIADEKGRANKIFDMSQLAYIKLPWWMRPEKAIDNRGEGVVWFNRKDKQEQINNPGLESYFFVDAANKPSGSSRGFTLHNLHATEFGLWAHPEVLTSDIIPAIPKKNPMVISIVEGTAKGSGENYSFLRMWKMAMEGRGLFRPVFAAWWKEKTYCKPFPSQMDEDAFEFTKEETELAAKVKDEFDYDITKPQMAWRRDQADQFEATEGDPEKVEQEYPSYARSAFRSGGICRFSVKKLTQVEVRDVKQPKWYGDLIYKNINGKDSPVLVRYPENMRFQAPLWVWEWPNSKDIYYGASDPAGGIVGQDYSAIQIFRVPKRNGERIRQCLEYRGYADPKELAKIVVAVGLMYNTCELAPECNAMTEHIHNIVFIHKYPKLYRWRRQDKTKNRFTHFYGWDTGTHKHREDLMSRFNALLQDDSVEIRSSRLLSECMSFIKLDDTDRFEAGPGEHDDALFAAMICCYCLMELDPRLFNTVDQEQPLPDKNVQKHNTDFSLYDEEQNTGPVQYNAL